MWDPAELRSDFMKSISLLPVMVTTSKIYYFCLEECPFQRQWIFCENKGLGFFLMEYENKNIIFAMGIV